ncbi:hypothetical protein DsansV1_C10g0105671 [Dioscorea sansibarensis]
MILIQTKVHQEHRSQKEAKPNSFVVWPDQFDFKKWGESNLAISIIPTLSFPSNMLFSFSSQWISLLFVGREDLELVELDVFPDLLDGLGARDLGNADKLAHGRGDR